ncbi:MAG: 2-amino-4-hydroxy-6-hydroxymethyldihydropteridine diphosphokinase [Rhodospirillales bacterium]
MTEQIYIALGSNLAAPRCRTPAETIESAINALQTDGLPVVRRSAVWLTEPVPVSDQPWYANAVIETACTDEPAALMTRLHRLESEFRRVRSVPNAARTLDLDLLDYAGQVSKTDQDWPHLPHPRLQDRAFVLLPLQEIAPDWKHPQSRLRIGDLVAALDPSQKATRIEPDPLRFQHPGLYLSPT